ncbi:MAG: phosphoribosyltransferase family protein [Conexivisphaerales archaeon]
MDVEEKMNKKDAFAYVQSVVQRLRIVKKNMSYDEIQQATGIHRTLLCRYVTGSIRPSVEQAMLIDRLILSDSRFIDMLRDRMMVRANGYLDLHLLLSDPDALKWIAGRISSDFKGEDIDTVLTAASSGIPLATSIAIEIGARLVYATRNKSSGAVSYLESDIQADNPSEIFTLYIPSAWIKRGSKVLVVDDVATTGKTMASLIQLGNKAGCKVKGIFVLVSRSNRWRERISGLIDKSDTKISILFEVGL